ncbi:MAG: DUF1587 domain-containing protein, partial [Verrucomicrobiota bacterium]
MPKSFSLVFLLSLLVAGSLHAIPALMKEHCAQCHNDEKAKGQFRLSALGETPSPQNMEHWIECLDLVKAGEMPPEEESKLSDSERQELVAYLSNKLHRVNPANSKTDITPPRRLNNREFANSVRDVLLLEDVGTDQPTANLIGDTRHHGFDTHGETLGFSRFHVEQYLVAARKIVNGTILSGDRPASQTYTIPAEAIFRSTLSQNPNQARRRGPVKGRNGAFDLLDPRLYGYFKDFTAAPETGRYKITIRCTGKDRLVYDSTHTGMHRGDPIQLKVRMGDRDRVFDLPDEEVTEIKMDEWLAAGTRIEIHHPTDGLREKGNGNFKF